MIFSVIGLFKDSVPPRDNGLEAAINDHLAQPFRRIVNAGYLRNAQGAQVGVLALIEVATFDEARRFVEDSPFQHDGYFERVQVAEYDVEVGRLG